MDDYISRLAAIKSLFNEIIKRRIYGDVNDGMLDEFDTESILRKVPSEDVQPVRHGKWVELEPKGRFARTQYVCSECGAINNKSTNFCPNCGARMDGDTDG